ncbi:hypothetical protein L6164_030712 [Bauhinia variegata]|uniref:Uncharacterized protein n=1 Tax=Bauhinia variegata TaxID=167791 RepID=A0ACB9LE24_BAUVA|nr:hypothetical protein L6164_030712 [Bauhinia variegata]
MSNPQTVAQGEGEDLSPTSTTIAEASPIRYYTENANGQSSVKPYPPPTALYDELVQNSNLFWEKLQSFHESSATKFKVPIMGGKPLDLYQLFIEVTSRGGLEKVIGDRKWKEVIAVLKLPSSITSGSFVLRKYYLSLLYHFEQVYYFRRQTPPFTIHDAVDGNLANISATKEGAAANDLPSQVTPVQQPGSWVTGTIDKKFDGGYVVTVNLGSDELQGILYYVPANASESSYTAGMPASHNRKRSRLALRDPSRPKSNRSGYNFFFAEHYAKLKPLYSGQERAISKRIGYLWNNLTDAERQVYQDKGQRDKERYRTEMLEYKSSCDQTPQ